MAATSPCPSAKATAQFVRAYALLAERRFDEAEPLLRWLDERAADAPANFQHLAGWLAAERAWAAGDPAAGVRFDEALRAAGRQRRPWQHAFLAFKHAMTAIKVLNKPRPAQAPEGWPGWPTWFSGFAFFHNRQFGGWLILGLIVDTLLHVIPFTADLIQRYWPPM